MAKFSSNVLTHDERFVKNALHLHEFVVFKSKLPSSKSANAVERSLAKFIARSKKAKLSQRWKHALLHRSLRRFDLVTGRMSDCRDTRSGWSYLFDQWCLSVSTKETLDFADPVSNRNYIPRGCSPEEHMVRQMGVAKFFEPDEHSGFGCTIRSVPLRWLAIGFRAFDKLFYNRNSIRSYRDPTEIAKTFAPGFARQSFVST